MVHGTGRHSCPTWIKSNGTRCFVMGSKNHMTGVGVPSFFCFGCSGSFGANGAVAAGGGGGGGGRGGGGRGGGGRGGGRRRGRTCTQLSTHALHNVQSSGFTKSNDITFFQHDFTLHPLVSYKCAVGRLKIIQARKSGVFAVDKCGVLSGNRLMVQCDINGVGLPSQNVTRFFKARQFTNGLAMFLNVQCQFKGGRGSLVGLVWFHVYFFGGNGITK